MEDITITKGCPVDSILVFRPGVPGSVLSSSKVFVFRNTPVGSDPDVKEN